MRKFRCYSWMLLLVVIISVPLKDVKAQFSDSIHHVVNLSSSGNFNRTNDGITYLFNNGLRYGMKKESAVVNFSSKWVYGMTPEKLTNNDFSSALDFNWYKTLPHFYYWGLASFVSSYSLKLNEQWQGGAGVAYRIIDRESMMLSVSDGMLYEYSNMIPSDETADHIYRTFRNSLRLQYRLNHRDLISFSSAGFYQPSVKDFQDYIVTVNASVSLKVWRWVSFTASIAYNNVSRTGRENTLVTYGLVAERFF